MLTVSKPMEDQRNTERAASLVVVPAVHEQLTPAVRHVRRTTLAYLKRTNGGTFSEEKNRRVSTATGREEEEPR